MEPEHLCSNGGRENGEGRGVGEAELTQVWTHRGQEREGEEEESGEGEIQWSDLKQSEEKHPDVHWERVSKLDPDKDINYTGVIERQSLRAAFQHQSKEKEHTTFFAGGLYAKLPEEDKLRCVYFEAQPDPARPIMRVAVDEVDNDTVKQYYPWDRVNFVFQEVGMMTYKCYIYTPANRGSYGLVVEKEEVYFKPTTKPDPKEEFTLFQIELLRDITVIKVDKSDVGLYVDAHDGCKVKATADRQKWSKCAFLVSKFLPQDKPTSENRAQQRRMNFCVHV